MNRRGSGEGSVFYEPERDRWVGLVTLPADGTGKRRRAKVVGATKTAARHKLNNLRKTAEEGLPTGHGGLTLSAFLDTWLTTALPARSNVRSTNTLDNYRWAAEPPVQSSARRRSAPSRRKTSNGCSPTSQRAAWPAAA